MKILVLSNLYPPDVIGGYELGCRQAVDSLRALAHEVRVLTTAPRVPVAPQSHVRRTMRLVDAWSDYHFKSNAVVTNLLEQGESLRVNAFNIHALLAELDEFRPDVVYVWMLVGIGGLGLMACLHHLRVPWVWHLMDDVPLMLCRSGGRLVPAFAREFNRQLKGSYIACSTQLVDEIEDGGITLSDRVVVVPNWIDGPARPARAEYLRGGTLRIVTAAGLIDRQVDKGIDILIEAAARLRERGHDCFTVEVYGRSTDGYAAHLIHRFGLESHVFLRGSLSQSELSERFEQADVFAFPTRAREPFGFAPLEAAARGCVPIISQTCGLAEWFVHGVHLLKSERTADGFAKVFAAILEGAIDLSSIGRRAACVVRREFHLDAIAPKICEVLEDAAGRPRTGAGTAAEAYRLARLAEKLSHVLIQESLCA